MDTKIYLFFIIKLQANLQMTAFACDVENAFCSPLLYNSISMHMPLKIIFQKRNSGSFLFENNVFNHIETTLTNDPVTPVWTFPMLNREVTDSGKNCTINH